MANVIFFLTRKLLEKLGRGKSSAIDFLDAHDVWQGFSGQ